MKKNLNEQKSITLLSNLNVYFNQFIQSLLSTTLLFLSLIFLLTSFYEIIEKLNDKNILSFSFHLTLNF